MTVTNDEMTPLTSELRTFLNRVRAGQCLALAAWAAGILRADAITMTDLARCINLGFERPD